MPPYPGNRKPIEAPRLQSGLALLVALIVLVAMSLAGIALVRSVDTNALVASNIAFRQSATHSSDLGIEAARAWLTVQSAASLQVDNAANGYYATSQDALDLTGNKVPEGTGDDVQWQDYQGNAAPGIATPRCLAPDGAGNRTCYIIHRLCDNPGPLDAASCSTLSATMGGSSKGALRPMQTYQERSWTQVTASGYYRVTVRTVGPRNNATFAQVFLIV